MGDWNEWNDLQETNDIFEPVEIETKPMIKNKELVTDLVNEPNKYVYKRKVEQVNNNNKKKYITKKITMYSSGSYGNYIVNPLDNTPYNIKVGSKEEVKFFSVRFTAKRFQGQDDEPITLYYDSPYTYERHHHVSLPRHILQNWEITRVMLNKRPNFNQPIESVASIDNLTQQQQPQTFIQVK